MKFNIPTMPYLECVDRIAKLLEIQNQAHELLQKSQEMLNDRKIQQDEQNESHEDYIKVFVDTRQEIARIKFIIEQSFNWDPPKPAQGYTTPTNVKGVMLDPYGKMSKRDGQEFAGAMPSNLSPRDEGPVY